MRKRQDQDHLAPRVPLLDGLEAFGVGESRRELPASGAEAITQCLSSLFELKDGSGSRGMGTIANNDTCLMGP